MRSRTNPISIALIITILLVAGCVAGPGDNPVSKSDADGDASAVVTDDTQMLAHCTGNETTPDFNIDDRELPNKKDVVRLNADSTKVEHNNVINFTLTNHGDETIYTGTRARYAIQKYDSGNWDTITLFHSPNLGFNETAVPLPPDSNYTWSFRASAKGFSKNKYNVCRTLQPGKYRFVYMVNDGLATEFEITNETR